MVRDTASLKADRWVPPSMVCWPLIDIRIDKRVELLAVLVVVGDDHLDVVAFEVYHGIERGGGHLSLSRSTRPFFEV